MFQKQCNVIHVIDGNVLCSNISSDIDSEDFSHTNLNSFFENGKFYILCNVV